MCDVTNPLYGTHGAAYVYAPQKGADKRMVVELDKGLISLAKVIQNDFHMDVSNVAGSGAAGGLGAGILAFANGTLQSGIETILSLLDFDKKIKDTEFVVSGEGKLDQQSFSGKVVEGVASRCQKENKRLILVVGNSDVTLKEAQALFPCTEKLVETNDEQLPLDLIKNLAKQMYRKTISRFLISSHVVNLKWCLDKAIFNKIYEARSVLLLLIIFQIIINSL